VGPAIGPQPLEDRMQIGIVGLGRMGLNIAIRLSAAGHQCVAFDHDPAAIAAAVAGGAKAASDVDVMLAMLAPPRIIWLMVPAAAVDSAISGLVPGLTAGDILVDGGNSNYHDDLRRAHALQADGLHYVDVGVSGGVWGRERGFCHMIGGEDRSSGLWRRASRLRRGPPAQSANPAMPSLAICIAARPARAISSRWFTTASNMA
jgi:6-phosphogluconate dehydrogenase (decarboxylating)